MPDASRLRLPPGDCPRPPAAETETTPSPSDVRRPTSDVFWARVQQAEDRILPRVLPGLQQLQDTNTAKVLQAFLDERIGEHHLTGTTGMGHDDLGRTAVEAVFARVFRAEAALVRQELVSGTHAIAAALFGVLRPGDELLAATGPPYDTLEAVIGLRDNGPGTLHDWGIAYREVPLGAGGEVDIPAVCRALTPRTRMVFIQRSRGYQWRPSIGIEPIRQLVEAVKEQAPQVVCLVDNCYGEFTEPREPLEAGADLMAGSLIKNPGGGIVPKGGYVAGCRDLVEMAACRLNAPGIGRAGGASLDANRWFLQGLFLAPHIVGEALKGMILAAAVLEELGYEVSPRPLESRTDIIQAVRLSDPQLLQAFCRGIQRCSPIGSYLEPVPSEVPGYADQVVMAGGTFIEGSTIELSADGPLRPPYCVYLQGGLSYSHVKLALVSALQELERVRG